MNIIILLCGLSVLLMSSILIVKINETAVVFRLGKYIRTCGPGVNFTAPFIDKAFIVIMSARTIQIASVEMSDVNGKTGRVSLSITTKAVDPLRTIISVENLDKAIQEILIQSTKDFVKTRSLDQFGLQLSELESELKNSINEVSNDFGISLLNLSAFDYKA